MNNQELLICIKLERVAEWSLQVKKFVNPKFDKLSVNADSVVLLLVSIEVGVLAQRTLKAQHRKFNEVKNPESNS